MIKYCQLLILISQFFKILKQSFENFISVILVAFKSMSLSYWWVGQRDKINILILITQNLEIRSPLFFFFFFFFFFEKVRISYCNFQLFWFILFPSWLKYLGNKVQLFCLPWFFFFFFYNKPCHLKFFWFMLWPSLFSNLGSVPVCVQIMIIIWIQEVNSNATDVNFSQFIEILSITQTK